MTNTDESSRTVWTVLAAEQGRVEEAGLALAGEARRLATAGDRSSAVLVFGADGTSARALARYADRVIVAPPAGPDGVIATASSIIAGRGTDLILVAERERDIAGRLAARLRAGVVPSCSAIEGRDGRFIFHRPVYGGLASAAIDAPGAPVVASILSATLRAPIESGEDGEVEECNVSGGEERVGVVARERLALLDLPLAEADVIVAGGLGLGGPENIPLLEDLADALGGTVAGSRPVIDRGWLPPERQVGQSGAIVSPKVYVACGISGATQHVVGMRGAGVVIAVNEDAGAPMMKLADVPIVGDLREILPAMTAAVRAAGRPATASMSRAAEASR